MATEVDNNSYLHCLGPSTADPADPAPVSTSGWLEELKAARQMVANAALGKVTVDQGLPGALSVADPAAAITSFRHNPLHDMESFVWLSLYLLLIGTLVEARDATPEQLSKFTNNHHRLARKLFTEKVTRRDVINDKKRLEALVTAASLHPQAKLVGFCLVNMTNWLIDAYIAAERTLDEPIKFTVAQDNKLYDRFRHCLLQITALLVQTDLIVTVDAKSCEQLRQALAKPDLPDEDEDEDEIGAPAAKKAKTESSQ